MQIQFNPPPFVEKIQYKNCKQINDPVTRKRAYLTPDGESLPSVTTILSATKDMTHLNEWKNRIGHAKAQQITTEASGVGTGGSGGTNRVNLGTSTHAGTFDGAVTVRSQHVVRVVSFSGGTLNLAGGA
jgi:hypothetical protein